MNDLVDGVRHRGSPSGSRPEHLRTVDQRERTLRTRIGMVFQKSNPFPKSIYENVALRLPHPSACSAGAISTRSSSIACAARRCEEVKDRLDESALGLSGGQSAAALVHRPCDRRRAGRPPARRALLRPSTHTPRQRSKS